jgi:thioredoxin-related protein
MRLIFIKFLSIVLFVAVFFNANSQGIHFQNLSTTEALAKAKKEHKLVFIDVYTDWCGPCKYLSNSVFIDQALGDYMNEHFVSIKVNGEDGQEIEGGEFGEGNEEGEGVKIMEEFSIDAYPTLLFLDPERKLLKKVVGAMEAEALIEKVKGVISPETTKLYQLNARFEKGERDKPFLIDLFTEKINEEENTDVLMKEYLRLHPVLNLEDKDDFMVFRLMEKDFKHPLVVAFLNEPEKYFELYGNLALEQLQIIFENLIESSKETRDMEAIDKGMDVLYPAIQVMAGDQDTTKEEIRASIVEYFNN